jgi:4-alpha-glucanotransferase
MWFLQNELQLNSSDNIPSTPDKEGNWINRRHYYNVDISHMDKKTLEMYIDEVNKRTEEDSKSGEDLVDILNNKFGKV